MVQEELAEIKELEEMERQQEQEEKEKQAKKSSGNSSAAANHRKAYARRGCGRTAASGGCKRVSPRGRIRLGSSTDTVNSPSGSSSRYDTPFLYRRYSSQSFSFSSGSVSFSAASRNWRATMSSSSTVPASRSFPGAASFPELPSAA